MDEIGHRWFVNPWHVFMNLVIHAIFWEECDSTPSAVFGDILYKATPCIDKTWGNGPWHVAFKWAGFPRCCLSFCCRGDDRTHTRGYGIYIHFSKLQYRIIKGSPTHGKGKGIKLLALAMFFDSSKSKLSKKILRST